MEELWAHDTDYGVPKLAWLAYQGIIDCYQMSNKRQAKKKMLIIIDQLRVLKGPHKELAQLGRSLFKRLGVCWRISMWVYPTGRSKRSTDV